MSLHELLYEAQFHGSTRLAERKNRYCWSVVLALMFCTAASIVVETISRFLDKPAFLAISDSKKTMTRFPSVGICPEIYYPEYKVDKFLSELYYPPGVNFNGVKSIINQLAAFYIPDLAYNFGDLQMIESLLDYNALTVEGAGRRLIPSCEEILLRCSLFGRTMNCSSLFTMELTNYGFCCIFNGRSLSREMMTSSSYKTIDPPPLYTSMTGPTASLMTVVNNSQDIKDIKFTYKRIFLEQGKQFAETVGNGKSIYPNTELWVGYDTRRFIIAEEESPISPQFRGCFLSSTQLEFFSSYSKRYCMLECQMAQTARRCKCVKVNHPRPNSVPPCRARSMLCVKNSAVTSKMCNCRVTCDSAVEILTVQSYPLMSSDYAMDQFYSGFNLSKVSVIRAYVVKHEKRLHSRRTYYTSENLFSQIGGVFSIFFGCSVLSLIEVLQLAWHRYLQYKADRIINQKSQLILPLVVEKKKKMKTKKIVNKNEVFMLQACDYGPRGHYNPRDDGEEGHCGPKTWPEDTGRWLKMNIFRHLMSEAQFHGSNRIKEYKNRCCWAVSLVLCFLAACSIICATISRFFQNPAHLVITETTNELIRFPSVIACPEIIYPEYKIDDVLSTLKYPPGMNETAVKQIIQQLAAFYSPDVQYATVELKMIEQLLDYNKLDVEDVSRRLTTTCEETVLRCRYFGIEMNCSNLFKMELTNYGYCCIFNGRSLRREMKDHGVQKAKPPKEILSGHTGHHSGIIFVVNSSQSLRDIDRSYKWLYLEDGLQYAESGGNGTAMTPNTEIWITHDSERFLIDEDAKNLSPELRRCRLSTEKLQYFPRYSKRYCYMECEMRRTMRRCHCVRITHPRPPQWSYCDAQHLLCVKDSAVPYAGKACNCPPTCDTNINAVMSQTYPLMPGGYIIDPIYDDLNFEEVTVVRAFILRHNSKINARRSYYTSINLFSQIGGTVNVFFGCSILTILELVQLIWYGYRQYQAVLQNRKKKPKIKPQVTSAKVDTMAKKKAKKKVVKFRKRW